MQTISHSTLAHQTAQLNLIEYVYTLLPARARRLARMFRETCGAVLDSEDITQAGIECAMRRLDKALLAVNPAGYLLHVAQFGMLHYCQEQRAPIRVPHVSQWRGRRVPVVLSLDAPLVEGEEMTLLDQLADESCAIWGGCHEEG